MSRREEKKVILITGASSGMGKDAALALIKDGHKVYGTARTVEEMRDLVKAGGHTLRMDVTKKEEIQKAVAQIIKEQGRIDVLFNNAGYGSYGPIETVSDEEAFRQFDVNIFGLAKVTKEVTPHMRKQKSGLIINTSSMGGKVYTPFGGWYHATKHALEGLSDCLRFELKEFGVKVVVLEPGGINTPWGTIAGNHLIESTKGTPYEKKGGAYGRNMKETYESGNYSDVSVISNLVVKIVNSKNPRRRYLKGAYAKMTTRIRRYFGDGVYESLLDNMVKQAQK